MPLLSFFKDRDLSRVDPRLQRATLADLLTMRSGIEWHEQDRPLDPTNTTVQLEWSKDWIAFTLSQPMDADPGTKWAYNSGGSALMAGIIRTATGRHIDEYANEWLFRPIGIRDFHWKKTPTGHPDTEGGLYLAADDLARIGYLYLQRRRVERPADSPSGLGEGRDDAARARDRARLGLRISVVADVAKWRRRSGPAAASAGSCSS